MNRENLELKYDRGIFIYLAPRNFDRDADFAQCESCRMFVHESALKAKEGSRCIIHGARAIIDEDDSCGFWVPWPEGEPVPRVIADHAAELDKGVAASITPEQSGLVGDRVQCHRCAQFEPKRSRCGLYAALNEAAPQVFDLDEQVKPHACCNAWTDEVASAGDLRAQIRGALSRA
jgi:hypothetical protein